MGSKKIYLIRHGQTDFNLRGIVQGSGVNSSLNEKGVAQANAFYQAYKHIPFQKIYTSALNRSIESVKPFIDLGIPFESLQGLNEISWGKKEGQPITPDEDAYYHYVLKRWNAGETSLKIEGGESPEDVILRMIPAVEVIMAGKNENPVLICMHGRAMRILLCYLQRYPLHCMDLFEHENLCLYTIEELNGVFNVLSFNDTHHLETLRLQPVAPVTVSR